MHLDSDLLRTFVAVAESGNFTRAAEMVGRTQSAVSMQVKKLEETVGERLFARGPRGVELTRKGSELLKYGHRIVAMLEEAETSLSGPPLDGPVRIGLPEEYGQLALTRALGAFAKRHSNVDVIVRYGPSADHRANVAAGKLDLAIAFEWQEFSEGETMMVDPTVWVTSDRHAMHLCSPLPIALYESSGWCTDFAIRSLEQRGVEYRIAYSSDTSGGLKLAVASGLAIAPISRSNIPPDCRELTAADGFGDIDTSRVVLYRGRHVKNIAVDSMAEVMREAFQSIGR